MPPSSSPGSQRSSDSSVTYRDRGTSSLQGRQAAASCGKLRSCRSEDCALAWPVRPPQSLVACRGLSCRAPQRSTFSSTRTTSSLPTCSRRGWTGSAVSWIAHARYHTRSLVPWCDDPIKTEGVVLNYCHTQESQTLPDFLGDVSDFFAIDPTLNADRPTHQEVSAAFLSCT